MAGNCSLKKALLIIVLGVCAMCYGAKTLSSSVLRLRHIESAEAIEILGKLGIGESINKVKGVNAIIISDSSEELLKAKAIMKVADSEGEFSFEQLPVVDVDVVSIAKRVEKGIRNVSVGTFREPVFSADKIKAVVGLSDGKLIVGSTPEMVKKITAIVGDVPVVEPAKQSAVEATEIEKVAVEIEEQYLPDETKEVAEVKSNEDEAELFDDLVLALEKAETETAAAEKGQAVEAVEVIEEKIEQPVEKEVASQNDKGLLEAFLKQVKQDDVDAEADVAEEVVEVEQEPAVALAEPFIPDGNEVLDLELPEKVNIINLLDLLGEYLQLDYLYDAAQIKGDIMLKIQGSITVKDLYSYVEAILKSKGFAMVRGRGNLVMIVKTADAIKYDPTLIGKDRSVKAGNVFVTNVFDLEHIETTVGAKLLADMKLGGAVVQIPELKSLIVTNYAYRMQRIEDLLKLIDKPGEPKSISYRTIEYISVGSLIPKLEKLAGELGSVSIVASVKSATPAKAKPRRGKPKPTPAATAAGEDTVFLEADDRTNRIIMIGLEEQIATVNELIDSLDIAQQDLRKIRNYVIQNVAAEEAMNKLAELGIASAGKGSSKQPVRPRASKAAKGAPAGATTEDAMEDLAQIVLLESTNSLLINGTIQQHEKIETILAYVDQVSSDAAVPYVIYPLEYQEPSEIADTLNQIIEKTLKATDGKDKVVKAPSFEEETIEVVADEKSFSLIVYASRKNQEWIGKLIGQLDQKRPQVLLEVTLVEIRENDTFDKDIDIVTSIPNLINTSGFTNIGNGMGGSSDGNNVIDDLLASSMNRFVDFGSNSGSGAAFYGDDSIQALLTLVQTNDYGRVLATPKILVNDNEEGVLTTEDSIFVGERSTSNSLTSESFQTSTKHVEYKSGITLTITPHISEGDLLLLDISMERSDFKSTSTDDADGNPLPPGVISTNITTFVTVPDASTIILGGMNKLNQGKGGSKVPFFGDIPLIGELFRSNSESNIQTKLYIFVKAQISRPREGVDGLPDLVRISREYADSFEEAEKKFQEYQTVSGVDPEPMEPERVLEMK